MIENFKKHHIGIVITPDSVVTLENKWDVKFHKDELQGVRVHFRWNEEMKLYEEYITKEGRASNYPLGFHHICYHLSGEQELKEIDDYLKKNQLGFKLTFLEKSGSQECEHIIFYKIKNHGIVEFNIDGINL